MSRTVLVVDDDDEMRWLVRAVLGSRVVDVHEAADGTAALALVRAGGIDLVVLDLGLPALNGVHVGSALKSDPATAAIPVVIVSALPEAADHARTIGADAYVPKPFAPRVLRRVVATLLLQAGPSSLDDAHCSGWSIGCPSTSGA